MVEVVFYFLKNMIFWGKSQQNKEAKMEDNCFQPFVCLSFFWPMLQPWLIRDDAKITKKGGGKEEGGGGQPC